MSACKEPCAHEMWRARGECMSIHGSSHLASFTFDLHKEMPDANLTRRFCDCIKSPLFEQQEL